MLARKLQSPSLWARSIFICVWPYSLILALNTKTYSLDYEYKPVYVVPHPTIFFLTRLKSALKTWWCLRLYINVNIRNPTCHSTSWLPAMCCTTELGDQVVVLTLVFVPAVATIYIPIAHSSAKSERMQALMRKHGKTTKRKFRINIYVSLTKCELLSNILTNPKYLL